jgi:hypothetical protein
MRVPPIGWRAAVLPVWSAALTVAIVFPLLGHGFALSYDMVFAPTQYLVPDAIGTGSALGRSVPADAVVALVTKVLPGDVVEQLILTSALFASALGAGLLVPTRSVPTRLVAASAYVWSAYVAERLLIGQWPLLVAYACLPWIARAAIHERGPGWTARLVVACAPAVITPPGGLLAAGVAVVAAGRRGLRITVPVAVVLNAPWLVPSLLHPGGALTDAAGVAAFSARAENWGGAVLSVLGTGGIWNSDVTPTSRSAPLIPILVLAVAALALFGVQMAAKPWLRALARLGGLGVLLALLADLPGGAALLRWALVTVPGAGLLRDAQKWAAWWALPLALGFAIAVERIATMLRTRAGRRGLLVVGMVLPLLILPDLALGGWGRLAGVRYPADWAHVAELLAGDPHPGDVLALPLATYRQFGWNGGKTQLDPAPRALPRTTVTDDALRVGGIVVSGEDRRSALVRALLTGDGNLGSGLRSLGIGWVLVERGTPPGDDPVSPARLRGLVPRFQGQWLTLYEIPGAVATNPVPGAPVLPVVLTDVLACLLVLAALWRLIVVAIFSG